MIQKRNGDIQEFNYEKLYKGIENAFGGLDINDKKLKTLVDNIHNEIKTQGNKIKSEFVGETVLKYLKKQMKWLIYDLLLFIKSFLMLLTLKKK